MSRLVTLTSLVFLQAQNINTSLVTHLKKYFHATYELVSPPPPQKNVWLKVILKILA